MLRLKHIQLNFQVAVAGRALKSLNTDRLFWDEQNSDCFPVPAFIIRINNQLTLFYFGSQVKNVQGGPLGVILVKQTTMLS